MYPPELLRTFLVVSQSLSFTRAAELLEIRQPTVSQHIRRLEDAVGRTLFVRDTRTVRLTADGEAMAGFARTILAAQEQAADFFNGSGLAGRLRVGVTDDLALTPLPRILRQFRQAYPRVDLELTVAQSPSLHRRIESGHLDVVFVKRDVKARGGQLVRRDRLVWAGPDGVRFDAADPVPLVVYQAPSLTRTTAIDALGRAGMAYRIGCTVRGVNGVIAAVRAGLGLGVFARSLIPEELVELSPAVGLPTLGEIDLVLLTNPHADSAPAEALVKAILASGHPTR